MSDGAPGGNHYLDPTPVREVAAYQAESAVCLISSASCRGWDADRHELAVPGVEEAAAGARRLPEEVARQPHADQVSYQASALGPRQVIDPDTPSGQASGAPCQRVPRTPQTRGGGMSLQRIELLTGRPAAAGALLRRTHERRSGEWFGSGLGWCR